MVQLSTPGVTPNRGMGPTWGAFCQITLTSCWSRHENRMIFHWDMAICRFSKWRLSAILELFTTIRDHPRNICCWPQLPVKFHVNLIHRSEDIAVWIFHIFGLKCLFRSQNGVFWVLWTHICDYSSSRPQKAHPCVNSRLLSYQHCKNPLRVWPVGELTESVINTVTDRHTHTGKFIFCPCTVLDRQIRG